MSALKHVSTNSYLLNDQPKNRNTKHCYERDLLEGKLFCNIGYEEQSIDIISMTMSLLIGNIKNYIIFNLLLQVLE